MVIQPVVDVIDLLLNAVQNSQVLPMLLGVSPIKSVQSPHQWTAN